MIIEIFISEIASLDDGTQRAKICALRKMSEVLLGIRPNKPECNNTYQNCSIYMLLSINFYRGQ